jgi:uncharacterized membrane protein
MSDRDAELVRQRALVAEQLAALDRQIAEKSRAAPPSPPAAPAPPASLPPEPPSSVAPSVTGKTGKTGVHPAPPDAEAILAQYRVEPSSVKEEVRKGCLLYFALAFGLVGLAIMLVYFLLGSR